MLASFIRIRLNLELGLQLIIKEPIYSNTNHHETLIFFKNLK